MIVTSWKVKGLFKADAQLSILRDLVWVSAAAGQADMADIKSLM